MLNKRGKGGQLYVDLSSDPSKTLTRLGRQVIKYGIIYVLAMAIFVALIAIRMYLFDLS